MDAVSTPNLESFARCLTLHDVPVSLELHAQVRSSKSVPDEHGAMHHEYGMEFQNLKPNDRLILGSLLWYEMHMHPERAA